MAGSPVAAPGNAEQFAEIFHVSRETLDRLEAFVAILEKWQRKMNLVASSTLPNIWTRHILDSAQLINLLPVSSTSHGRRIQRIADIGSGAGFPGIILAILGAGEVHLIESDQRRAVFLREALRITETSAVVHAVRSEDMDAGPFDLVTARACAQLDRLLGFAAPLIGPETVCLFLKGQDIEGELTAATKYWRMDVTRHGSITAAGATILQLDNLRPRHDSARKH